MRAKLVYYDPIHNVEQIKVNGHNIQFGGNGDGYCYAHQSFDCLERITPEEQAAIDAAS